MTTDAQQQKTSRELDWPRLLDRVAAFCHSEAGAQNIRALLPESSFEAGRARMLRTREALALQAIAPIPAARIEDQALALEQVARGSGLDASELRALGVTLELSERLRGYLERHGAAAPALSEWLRTAPALASLEALIRRSVGPDGAILDSASPQLERARKRSLDLRHDLRQRLTGLMGRMGEAMQGQYVAERDGRYVLPVRADAPFRVDGLVLGSSASGSTLYVEPRETHELGNRVQLAEAEARAEEARVLQALNLAVSEQLGDVRAAQQACIEADGLRALALYARQAEAIAFEPRAEPRLELKKMRHPLLIGEGAQVVANDLSLGQGNGLILSGPNAGGKTVALECFGLAAWMVRAGIPIPAAEESIVGWFDPVFTDIGDNQSLVQSLSTFSAHVTHVCACLTRAAPGTLVLVDELTSGTDPDEGAALACAIVEALVERGAAVCVTTHYERLKALAASHPRLSNAAVGFDRERLLPTFSVEQGVPGASSALLVAQRYGIWPDIITRAEALLPHGLIDQRALERELDEQRARWQTAADEAEAERRTAAELRRQLDKERSRALTEERGVLTRETQAVLDEVRQARVRLRQAEAKVKSQELGASSVPEVRRAVNEAAEFVAIGGKLRKATAALDPAPARSPEPLAWDDLVPGARVTLSSLGASGHVVAKPRRDQVTVAVGSMKTTVSINALSLLPGQASAPSVASTAGKSSGNKSSSKKRHERDAVFGSAAAAAPEGGTPQRTSVNTVSLIGQRVDAALEQLDVAIDKLLRSGEHVAFVLHGHGTGALKNAVREHVRRHPNVVRAEPAERDDGGDALTLLWLG